MNIATRLACRLAAALLVALALTASVADATPAAPALPLPALTEEQIEAFTTASAEGNAAVKEKDWARAARSLQRATRIHGGNDGLWYNLACVQALQGRTKDALASLQRAGDAGWPDPGWPAKDSDLASLHELPEFQAWLKSVEERAAAAKTAPKPDPGPLAANAAEIESASETLREKLDELRPVLGSAEWSKADGMLRAWQLASWDALAASATTPDARAEASWSALRSLLYEDLEPRTSDGAAEIASRGDRFAREHPESSHAPEARVAAATARMIQAWMAAEGPGSDPGAEAAYERELLHVAATATATEGAGLQQALVKLSERADDIAAARAYARRLRAVVGDQEKYTELMLTQARGTHYRIEGLPEFKAVTLDGRTVTPADLRGKVTLLDFWATWCGPCVRELPHLKAAQEKFKGRGFEIVGVSLDTGKDATAFQAWCAENGLTWPQVFDGKGWESGIGKTFGVKSIPFALLVDREGRVVYADSQLRGEQLLERIESALDPAVGL